VSIANTLIALIGLNFVTFEVMYPLIYIGCVLSTFLGVYADAWPASQQRLVQSVNENKDPFDPLFDGYVEDLLRQCHVPGVSIAVVDGGRITSKVSLPHLLFVSSFQSLLLGVPNLDRATASLLSPTK
jgi:hypothetical protein